MTFSWYHNSHLFHFTSAQHQIFKDLMGNTCFSTIRFSALLQIGPGPSVIISLNKESGGEICFVSTWFSQSDHHQPEEITRSKHYGELVVVSVPDVHKHNGSPHVWKWLSFSTTLSPIVAIFSCVHNLIVQRFPFQVSEKCTSNLLKIWDGCPWHVILFPGIPLISSWSPFTALIRPSI